MGISALTHGCVTTYLHVEEVFDAHRRDRCLFYSSCLSSRTPALPPSPFGSLFFFCPFITPNFRACPPPSPSRNENPLPSRSSAPVHLEPLFLSRTPLPSLSLLSRPCNIRARTAQSNRAIVNPRGGRLGYRVVRSTGVAGRDCFCQNCGRRGRWRIVVWKFADLVASPEEAR